MKLAIIKIYELENHPNVQVETKNCDIVTFDGITLVVHLQ